MLKCRLAYSLLLIRSKGFKRATNCFLVKVDDLLKELFHLMPFFHLYSDSFQFKKLFFFFFLQWYSTFQPRSSSPSQALLITSACIYICLHQRLISEDRDDFVWLWSTGLCDGCWVIPNVGLFQAVRCFFFFSRAMKKERQWVMREEQEINDWNSTWLCDLTIGYTENLIIIVLRCYVLSSTTPIL